MVVEEADDGAVGTRDVQAKVIEGDDLACPGEPGVLGLVDRVQRLHPVDVVTRAVALAVDVRQRGDRGLLARTPSRSVPLGGGAGLVGAVLAVVGHHDVVRGHGCS